MAHRKRLYGVFLFCGYLGLCFFRKSSQGDFCGVGGGIFGAWMTGRMDFAHSA
jgi:hypothetical protein